MLKTVLLLAVLSSVSLIAQAQAPKEPWTLTVEERIALRTNLELARERVRRARRPQTLEAPTANREMRPSADDFDGKTHPELFLPHEVFRTLVNLAFLGPPRTGQLFRKGFMPEVKRRGLPPDFWERLRSVSAIYVADSQALMEIGPGARQQSGRARDRAEQALALKQGDECRSRADALAAARSEFGRERFDRFLYEVIAVNKFHSEDRLPDPKLLRWAEEGCR